MSQVTLVTNSKAPWAKAHLANTKSSIGKPVIYKDADGDERPGFQHDESGQIWEHLGFAT